MIVQLQQALVNDPEDMAAVEGMAYAWRTIPRSMDEIIELKMASVVKPLGKRKADRLEALTGLVAKRRAYIEGYLGHVRELQGA